MSPNWKAASAQIFTTLFFVLVIIVGYVYVVMRCDQKGGVLLFGALGPKCIDAKVLK